MAAFPTSPTVDDTHTYGGTSFKWNGTGWEIVPGAGTGAATGGTEVTSGGYKYHTFTASGTLTVTTAGLCECLLIGGGGAGNSSLSGAGGGAGGLYHISSLYLPTGSIAITIGAGGSGATSGTSTAPGGDSKIGTDFVAFGGGAGSSHACGGNNLTTFVFGGGSGGGCGGLSCFPAGWGVTGQGNNGGAGEYGYRGGGGGGAGSIGQNADDQGGDGGTGSNTYSAWATATSTGDNGYYCSGGAGNLYNGTGGVASDGGGTDSAQVAASDGAANTGGGAGAGGGKPNAADLGGNGGSGLVIVRYAV